MVSGLQPRAQGLPAVGSCAVPRLAWRVLMPMVAQPIVVALCAWGRSTRPSAAHGRAPGYGAGCLRGRGSRSDWASGSTGAWVRRAGPVSGAFRLGRGASSFGFGV
jgi:hypothetical protein